MSQEYNHHEGAGLSELMEWRVGLPLAAASFIIGARIVESILSKSPWTLDRGFRLGIASAFLVLVLWSWRIIRKDLKIFNRICDANDKLAMDSGASLRIRRQVAGLVSLYSSVTTIIVLAFLALKKV